MNRIGLFFGTFDPLHNGHVAISNYFISKLNLDELWLVVTPDGNPNTHAFVASPGSLMHRSFI